MKAINVLKVIFVALIILMGVVGMIEAEAQEKDEENVNPNLEYVGNQIEAFGNKVELTIKELAQKLEAPASHIYGVLIKQQKVKSISMLIIILAVFAGLIVVAYRTLGLYRNYLEDDLITWAIAFGLITLALIVIISLTAEMVLTGFINPEYGAIRDIVNLIN
jgi:uncharacterized membrane protein (DUF485 family)